MRRADGMATCGECISMVRFYKSMPPGKYICFRGGRHDAYVDFDDEACDEFIRREAEDR